jgi:hypothetical protein
VIYTAEGLLPFNLKSAIAPLKSYIVHRKSNIRLGSTFFIKKKGGKRLDDLFS